jgi:purine-binding chemotaxis protein CheW
MPEATLGPEPVEGEPVEGEHVEGGPVEDPELRRRVEGKKVIQFLLGKDHFALPLEDVAQITRAEGIVPLPLVPPFIAGVVNLQGRLASVASLWRIMTGKEGSGEGSLIVLVPERGGLALLVDTTTGIGEYAVLEEVGAEGTGSREGAAEGALVEGVFRRGSRLVSLISTRRLLSWIDGMMRKGES